MSFLKSALPEILGLFVDDGALALIGVVAVLVKGLALPGGPEARTCRIKGRRFTVRPASGHA